MEGSSDISSFRAVLENDRLSTRASRGGRLAMGENEGKHTDQSARSFERLAQSASLAPEEPLGPEATSLDSHRAVKASPL
jgi:hypothetical protein